MRGSPALLLDLYELTMAEAYLQYRSATLATFDLFVRRLPANRSYLLFAGLSDILAYIRGLRFTGEDIRYLKSLKFFSSAFLDYLSDFRFTGDVWAMPEGTVFFPLEPVVRVTAPVIQAQIIESFILNTVNLQTMIASKAARVVHAACGAPVYDFSMRRTHGQDAAIKAARSSYIAGCAGTATVEAGRLYGIPVAGTMAHSFVMSFKHELDSFLAYAQTFPGRSILLVDTYNTAKGVEHAVTIGLYLKEKGFDLAGIRLDSGNIVSLSKKARRLLDDAGLRRTGIVASGDLDEFKIARLIQEGACVNSFGVGTNMGTSIDAPSLDVIYKISEITDDAGKFLPTMKLSSGKVTYPGRKQIFRLQDKKGRFTGDILGLQGERLPGAPLLKKVIAQGTMVASLPSLAQTRLCAEKSLARFSPGMLDVRSRYRYPVTISPRLARLRIETAGQFLKRQ